MKKTKLGIFSIAVIAASLFAFKGLEYGSVKGRVIPAEGALRAWILSAKDTFRTDIIGGAFEINYVKNGTYRLLIEAKPPYKNASKQGITVLEGNPIDVGEIRLQLKGQKVQIK